MFVLELELVCVALSECYLKTLAKNSCSVAMLPLFLNLIRQAKSKISKFRSINEREREYLTIFCDLLEAECGAEGLTAEPDLESLQGLLRSDSVRKRFKNSYPIEV